MAEEIETVSRRSFLGGAAALAIAHGLPAAASTSALAYVGTYTGAPGAGGNGQGIELFEADPRTGRLSHRGVAAQTRNPSWIVIHPSKKYLYAVNEIADFQGNSGSVTAFAVDVASGELHALNTVSSAGADPAYVSLDVAGNFAFVANYAGGSIAVLPIRSDGSLGEAVDVHSDQGFAGSTSATSAIPGSFAISGHDGPHAHMVAADPHNNFVLATDLGQDRIYTWRFDRRTGRLTSPPEAPFVALPSGDGPRHFAFHPNGRWLYSIQEEASTVVFFQYNPSSGSLKAQQTLSALPRGFAGTSFASEILVSPNGKTLYAANRLHDTIAVFSIGSDGRPAYLTETSTLGDYPARAASTQTGISSTYAINAATTSPRFVSTAKRVCCLSRDSTPQWEAPEALLFSNKLAHVDTRVIVAVAGDLRLCLHDIPAGTVIRRRNWASSPSISDGVEPRRRSFTVLS